MFVKLARPLAHLPRSQPQKVLKPRFRYFANQHTKEIDEQIAKEKDFFLPNQNPQDNQLLPRDQKT
jgi:hypothetical protein